MTITTPEEFRQIGRQEGRSIAEGHSSAYMMFDPPNCPEQVAYLEGIISSLTAAVRPDHDGLTMTITREVEPKEISYMVFGTGALSYPWWGRVDWVNVIDDEEFPVDDHSELDTAEPNDVLIITHDTEDDDEGTFKGKTRLTFQQVVEAAAKAIRLGYVYDTDAIKEDLGMCDSEQADAVLQLAVFGGEKPVFG